ncbi:MAG: antibiotic biosynthesis monooxygenase family protein [Actinomycetes bacterium]
MTDWVVVLRFSVPDDVATRFSDEASRVARLLGARAGCLGVEVGRASDDPTLWVMSSRWQSVGAYRRAVSDYEIKVQAVPFLSQAIDEPTAFEVLFAIDAEGERAASGDLASDADTVDRSR